MGEVKGFDVGEIDRYGLRPSVLNRKTFLLGGVRGGRPLPSGDFSGGGGGDHDAVRAEEDRAEEGRVGARAVVDGGAAAASIGDG
ncbi:hypothetical protein QJS10_CPB15g01942 [Acorus calamus]|uniref:Uncharacterized protein n=1 Tax=Acorus calamus TaxID=4465 RepID=A0AAV9D4F0_ACOCL|nr:hypothetical protein QJS10_CPB15g01942 [Acorus calamus]